MKYVPFILKHLRRNWIRTSSTVMAMAVCIFLFCTLQTFIKAVTWNLQSANASRLVTRHNVGLIFPLPLAYKARIEAVPGVKRVSILSWFGGYRDINKRTEFFPNMAGVTKNHPCQFARDSASSERHTGVFSAQG